MGKTELARSLEDRMLAAAQNLDFEQAAKLSDELFQLRGDKPMEKKQPRPGRPKRVKKHK